MPATRTGRVDAPRIDAGARDKWIKIQRLNDLDQKDDSGYPIEDWDTLTPIELWASKVDVVGMERFVAAQVSAPYETRWGLEYREDMDPDLVNIAKNRRVIFQNRAYDVLDGNVVGDDEGIEIRTLARKG